MSLEAERRRAGGGVGAGTAMAVQLFLAPQGPRQQSRARHEGMIVVKTLNVQDS